MLEKGAIQTILTHQATRVTYLRYLLSQRRWWNETSCKLEKTELLCSASTLQNGTNALGERHPKNRGLDDQNRPERCIIHDSNNNLPIQLPAIRPIVTP